jgi:RND family efflux transporter MFP subunit
MFHYASCSSSAYRQRRRASRSERLATIATLILLSILTRPAVAQTIIVESTVLQLMDETNLAAGESGLLVELNVSEGDQVARGDVIARIDDTAARVAADGAKAELVLAKAKGENDVAIRAARTAQRVAEAELARSEESIARFPKSVSQSQLDVERLSVDKLKLEVEAGQHELRLARLAEEVARQKLAAAQLEIQRRRIVAPIHGVAVAVDASVGEWIEPGQQVVRLVSTRRLKAEGFVTASEAALGLIDSQAILVTPAIDGEVTGRVVFVSPEIDPINKQVRLWAEFDNPQGTLRPGQPVEMRLVLNSGTPDGSRNDP